MLNNMELLPVIERLNTKGRTGESIGISDFNCFVLYISERDEVELMIAAADYIIKKSKERPRTHSSVSSPLILHKNLELQSWTKSTSSLLQMSSPGFSCLWQRGCGPAHILLHCDTVFSTRCAAPTMTQGTCNCLISQNGDYSLGSPYWHL